MRFPLLVGIENEPLGLLLLGVLAVLTFVITIVTLVVSRKYLRTRISLSLEVERDPDPTHSDG